MDSNFLQRHRVNRTINFMRENSAEHLCLEQLADVACLSQFHFLRIFSAQCKETPIEFLTRIRLEKSVTDLVCKRDVSLTNIAYDTGFLSPEAFSRAFKRRYSTSPSIFRRNNVWGTMEFPNQNLGDAQLRIASDINSSPNQAFGPPTLRVIPKMRLAYIRHKGAYSFSNINAPSSIKDTIDILEGWAKEQGIWNKGSSLYGFCCDNPSVTPPSLCQYDVGIAIDEALHEDELVSIRTQQAVKVIALEVMPANWLELLDAWKWLINHWAPSQGFKIDTHAAFEIYDTESGKLRPMHEGVTLCLPLLENNAHNS